MIHACIFVPPQKFIYDPALAPPPSLRVFAKCSTTSTKLAQFSQCSFLLRVGTVEDVILLSWDNLSFNLEQTHRSFFLGAIRTLSVSLPRRVFPKSVAAFTQIFFHASQKKFHWIHGIVAFREMDMLL